MTDWERTRRLQWDLRRVREIAAAFQTDGNTEDADVLLRLAKEITKRRRVNEETLRRQRRFLDAIEVSERMFKKSLEHLHHAKRVIIHKKPRKDENDDD